MDPSGGRIGIDREETVVSTAALVTVGTVPAIELVQTSLQDGGRLLLMVAMALFLSYVLFMFGAVLLSAAADGVRSVRRPSRAGGLDSFRSTPARSSELHRISAQGFR